MCDHVGWCYLEVMPVLISIIEGRWNGFKPRLHYQQTDFQVYTGNPKTQSNQHQTEVKQSQETYTTHLQDLP